MPVFNHGFTLTRDGEESPSRAAAGTDRFGVQLATTGDVTAATVVLQGSISGADWFDLAEVTLRAPMTSSGGTAKSPVVRYLRVVARTLTGAGSVAVHVVAK